jgi:ZIP family zinc transporter
VSVTAALLLSIAAALATLLGWAVTAWRRTWPQWALGLTLLLAAIAMLLISLFELIPTAMSGVPTPVGVALLVGGALVVVIVHLAAHRLEWGDNHLHRSALIVAIAIGFHNIPEGAAPFGAALISVQAGLVTALAVGLHNIPEGIAVSAPVMAGGGSRRRAFVYTCVATGGEISGALLAALFAEALSPSRAAGLLACVAGIMVALSLVELGPSGIRLVRASARAARHTG